LQADDMQIYQLAEGAELVMFDAEPVVIDTIHKEYGTVTVYTIKVNNDHTYVANGIVTHNK
jgi:intein/homing endonuclease